MQLLLLVILLMRRIHTSNANTYMIATAITDTLVTPNDQTDIMKCYDDDVCVIDSMFSSTPDGRCGLSLEVLMTLPGNP